MGRAEDAMEEGGVNLVLQPRRAGGVLPFHTSGWS